MTSQITSQENDFRVVYHAGSVPEASIVAGRLEASGIPALVTQEPVGSALGLNVGILGRVQVAVRSDHYAQAVAILNEDADENLLEDENDVDDVE